MEKALVFDIWGDWGFFRKIETTSSPQSYAFPPRTTITGLIAAIFGYERDQYYGLLDISKCKIAIQILNPIVKSKMSMNLVDTKTIDRNFQFSGRTQVPFEFVREPKYRIFFCHNDKSIFEEFKKHLSNKTSVYTPSLGLAGNIASFSFLGEYDLTEHKNDEDSIQISTVIRISELLEISDLSKDYENIGADDSKEYLKSNMPRYFKNSLREVGEYAEYLYERKGKPITVKLKSDSPYFSLVVQDKIQNIVFM